MGKHHGLRVNANGKFGTWLAENMRQRSYTCIDMANLLHVSRQRIVQHIRRETRVDFPNVVAYC